MQCKAPCMCRRAASFPPSTPPIAGVQEDGQWTNRVSLKVGVRCIFFAKEVKGCCEEVPRDNMSGSHEESKEQPMSSVWCAEVKMWKR